MFSHTRHKAPQQNKLGVSPLAAKTAYATQQDLRRHLNMLCAGLGQVYLHGVRTGTPLRKYSFDSSDKLSLTASSAVVGNFSNRASVPIVSAVRLKFQGYL